MGRRWRRIEELFFYRYVLDEGDVGIMLIYLVTLDRYDYDRNDIYMAT